MTSQLWSDLAERVRIVVLGSLPICRLYWLGRGNLACFLPVLAMPAHLLIALARMGEFSDIPSLVGFFVSSCGSGSFVGSTHMLSALVS